MRCDQLLLFAEGTEHSQSYGSNVNYGDLPGFAPKSLGGASMIRYGHALQFPELDAYDPVLTLGHDVDYASLRDGDGYHAQSPLVPFHQHNVNGVFGGMLPTKKTTYYLGAGGGAIGLYDQEDADDIRGSQPEARQWLLARTAVALSLIHI